MRNASGNVSFVGGHSGNLAGVLYEEQVRDLSLLIVQGKGLHCLDGIGLPTSS